MTEAGRPAAWVATVAPEEAEGVLKGAYDVQARHIGEPTEFAVVGSPASQAGPRTSMLNQTPYCASGARHRLEHGGASEELIDQLGGGSEAGGTGDSRLDEIVRYTTILARSPADVTERDIEALREVGLSDGDIVAVNNLAAYFAYCNRITLGLGLRTQMPAGHAVPRWTTLA